MSLLREFYEQMQKVHKHSPNEHVSILTFLCDIKELGQVERKTHYIISARKCLVLKTESWVPPQMVFRIGKSKLRFIFFVTNIFQSPLDVITHQMKQANANVHVWHKEKTSSCGQSSPTPTSSHPFLWHRSRYFDMCSNVQLI